MPVSGGTADKLGNRYEVLWTIDRLLRVVDGALLDLKPEPLAPDESKGVEFCCTSSDGISEYWSVKRQTTKAEGWTLNLLTRKDERGRSILGDLFAHASYPKHHGFFASSLGAPKLEELRAYAASGEMLEKRLAQSAELKSAFESYILPLCNGDFEIARCLLQRVFHRAMDEQQLRERVNVGLRHAFYDSRCQPLDADAVRGYLADLILDNIHCAISRETIVRRLAEHSVLVRDWATEKSVRDRIDSLCGSFTAPLRSQLINGVVLPTDTGEGSLIEIVREPAAPRTFWLLARPELARAPSSRS